jgi:hypothetical protein
MTVASDSANSDVDVSQTDLIAAGVVLAGALVLGLALLTASMEFDNPPVSDTIARQVFRVFGLVVTSSVVWLVWRHLSLRGGDDRGE